MARSLARVEVRKNAESTTWYDAALRDVNFGRALVSFENGVWSDREVPLSSVRPRPLVPEESEFDTNPGRYCEVRVASSARNPCGWALGKVQAVGEQPGLLQVSFEGQSAQKVVTLQLDAVRAPSTEPCLDPLLLYRSVVAVDASLHQWLATSDAQGCLDQIMQVANLSVIGPGTEDRGLSLDTAVFPAYENDPPADCIVLIGSEKAVQRGQMLLQIHEMHQREVQVFHERRKRKLQQIHEARQQLNNSETRAKIEFEVDADLVGRMLGKGSENAKAVEAEHGVDIHVFDADEKGGPVTVRIFGSTQETVEGAKNNFQLHRMEYAVDEDRVGWVLGKGRREIQEVEKKTNLQFARWTGTALELCGKKSDVEMAALLLDNHNEYYSIYKEMANQNDEIQKSFEHLDEEYEACGLRPPGYGAARNGNSKKAPAKVSNRSMPEKNSSPAQTDREGISRYRRDGAVPNRSRGEDTGPASFDQDASGEDWDSVGRSPGGAEDLACPLGSREEAPGTPEQAEEELRPAATAAKRGGGRGRGAGPSGGADSREEASDPYLSPEHVLRARGRGGRGVPRVLNGNSGSGVSRVLNGNSGRTGGAVWRPRVPTSNSAPRSTDPDD